MRTCAGVGLVLVMLLASSGVGADYDQGRMEWSAWVRLEAGRFHGPYDCYTYRYPWRACDRLEIRVRADCNRLFAVAVLDYRGRCIGRRSGRRQVVVSVPFSAGYRDSHFTVVIESRGSIGSYDVCYRYYGPRLVVEPYGYHPYARLELYPPAYGDCVYLPDYDCYDLSGIYRLDGCAFFPNAYVTLIQVGPSVRIVIRGGLGPQATVYWQGEGRVRGRELCFEWSHSGRRGTGLFQLLADGHLGGEFRSERDREPIRVEWYRQKVDGGDDIRWPSYRDEGSHNRQEQPTFHYQRPPYRDERSTERYQRPPSRDQRSYDRVGRRPEREEGGVEREQRRPEREQRSSNSDERARAYGR